MTLNFSSEAMATPLLLTVGKLLVTICMAPLGSMETTSEVSMVGLYSSVGVAIASERASVRGGAT